MTAPRGRVVKILGKVGDPGVDILAIILRLDLPMEFPDEVLRAAEQVETRGAKAAVPGSGLVGTGGAEQAKAVLSHPPRPRKKKRR